MYQALYRKYRPRTFDQVVGQEHITDTLRSQVASGRLSHAYLFIGTRGTGKTTCAKILAKAVNCLSPVDGNPCGCCDACRGIDDGSVLDVVEIDAASNNSVDNVRSLRDEAIFSPASVKKRVYIIDEVHMLSTAAFNALLKILEEPPEHLMFILATTELRKVPATILSRCQRYSFRRIDSGVIASRLCYVAGQEGLELAPDAAALLSRLADGSMRDALSLLDQCGGASVIDTQAVISAMGLAGNRRVAELLTAVAAGDRAGALEAFASLWRDGKDAAGLLADLCTLMRDILILSVAGKNGGLLLSGGYDRDCLAGFSGAFTDAELVRDIQRVQDTLASLRDNPAPRTAAELCLVSLCDPTLTDGLPELRARLSALEARGAATPAIPRQTGGMAEPERTPEPEAAEDWDDVPLPEPEDGPCAAAGGLQPLTDGETPPWEEPVDAADGEDEPPAPPPQEPPAADGAVGWAQVAEAVKAHLPVGLRYMLDDPLQITGSLRRDTLELRIARGFASNMLRKPDMASVFREEASRLTGLRINVEMAEMDSSDGLEKRSLDELTKFGVRFK